MTLTLHEANRISKGAVFGTGPVYRYVVNGLPRGMEADVARRLDGTWGVLRVNDGVQGKWTGSYDSADEALETLQNEIQHLSDGRAGTEAPTRHFSNESESSGRLPVVSPNVVDC